MAIHLLGATHLIHQHRTILFQYPIHASQIRVDQIHNAEIRLDNRLATVYQLLSVVRQTADQSVRSTKIVPVILLVYVLNVLIHVPDHVD